MSRLARLAAMAIVLGAGALACGAHGGTGGDDDSGLPGDDLDGSAHDAVLPPLDGIQFADVGPDGGGGKGCEGLPDDTLCGAADACHDSAVCKGGVCTAQPKSDGTVCGAAPDACHDTSVCQGGACTSRTMPDGTVCAQAPDACHTDGKCSGGQCGPFGTHPESYNWNSNDSNARCCGGKPVYTTTDGNCGVCGIQCNKNNGESCAILGGHWFCRGCISSSACWSHCCSMSFSPYSCAASDCAGNCSSKYCPSGSHCVTGGGQSSDYCSY